MIAAGIKNIPLTKYLVKQVTQSPDDRIASLKLFIPTVDANDWLLQDAGQRVQVIKKDEKKGGVLEFGTELVHAKDGTLAALLGASPGASVSVSIMVELIGKCFPDKIKSTAWRNKLKQMLPSYAKTEEEKLKDFRQSRERTNNILHLGKAEVKS